MSCNKDLLKTDSDNFSGGTYVKLFKEDIPMDFFMLLKQKSYVHTLIRHYNEIFRSDMWKIYRYNTL